MSARTDPPSICVIIPAYNEQGMIRQVISGVRKFGYTIIVVDDGSATDLGPLLLQSGVYFLKHRINLGQGAALQTGIEFALQLQAEYLVTFDADGQHRAEDIGNMVEALHASHAEVAFGSRFMKGSVHNMPFFRKAFLQAARLMNFFFTGLLLTDAHNGLRVLTRKAAGHIHLTENGMAHASEILFQVKNSGLSYIEVPVHIVYTDYSRKKGQSIWSGFRIVFDLLLSKFLR